MNIKQTIKKVSALATGAAMLGATVMGAVALDLGDYPQPFVTDGAFSGFIVVGTKGANAAGIASDMVGAVNVGASLQAAAKTPVAVSGGSVTVAGGKDYDKQPLNGLWTAVTLTESKLDGFKDTTADFNDEDIDYHDELTIAENATVFKTSANQEDFAGDVYLTTDASGITYRVYFDDSFNTTYVDTGSSTNQDELEFYFLGKWITVQSVDSDGLGMTVEASSEHFVEEGDSLTIDGHDVTLVRVGDGSVIVEVDGQREVITNGESQTFDDADDFEVEVDSIFYIEGASDNGANLKLGNDLTESAQDTKSVELFGEPSDEDEADWLWDIYLPDNGVDGDQYIGIVNNIDRKDLDSSADERPALASGESLGLPNSYASIEFFGTEETSYVDVNIEISDGDITVNDGDGVKVEDMNGLIFTSDSGDDDFVVDSSVETSKVWVLMNNTAKELWYEDGDDESKATSTTFKIKFDDDEITVTPPTGTWAPGWASLPAGANLNATNSWSLAFDGENVDDALKFAADLGNDYFGYADDDESGELVYTGQYTHTSGVNIGSKDYDWGTDYGAVIQDPESQFGSGSDFDVMIPYNQQMGTLLVKSKGSVVSEESGDSGAYTVSKITGDIAILDTEAEGMLGSENLIVVGGPYVNSLAAELMGNPTADQIAAMFEPGKAKIKLFEDQNAILVAGFSAMDTTGAAKVLQNYEDYALSGSEVEVVVPSLSQISITEPTLPSMADDVIIVTE